MKLNYGVMQGRLTERVNNKIQAFPEKNWEKEFKIAKKINLKIIEWTLDYKNFYKNPLFTSKGQKKIFQLKKKYSIKIQSITGDCFMQKPFWKVNNIKKHIDDFKNLLIASKKLKIKFIIFPLVDNSSLRNKQEEFFFFKYFEIINK